MPVIFCDDAERERIRKMPEIVAQRDELLAVLKEARAELVAAYTDLWTMPADHSAVVAVVRIDAAIAKAEGCR